MGQFARIQQIVGGGGRIISVTLLKAPAKRSAAVGGMLLMMPDGTVDGRLVDDDFTATVISRVKAEAWSGPTTFAVEYGGEYRLFYDIWERGASGVIFGGGHISVVLADMLNMIGFSITVVDDRPEFANASRFSKAEKVICKSFKDAITCGDVVIDQQTAVIIVTRGHRYDLECLRGTINAGAGYLGMIGSRRRVGGILDILMDEGIEPAVLDRLYAPIGLDIGAATPAEIAVSIVAEIISVFRGGSLRSLKLRKEERSSHG